VTPFYENTVNHIYVEIVINLFAAYIVIETTHYPLGFRQSKTDDI